MEQAQSDSPSVADHARTLAAWSEMETSGTIRRDLLRDHVFRAWSRSHQAGSNPKLMRAVELSPSETTLLLEQEKDLIEAAKPYMVALSKAAGDDRHAAMLGDSRGIVLDVIGDEASVHGPESVPGPGALLSEAVAGANGIGTSLAEDDYVELVGVEHYIEGFHPFTCQGIPLRGERGKIRGVLSASVRRWEAARRVREILLCAAHGIEAELLRRGLEREVSNSIRGGGASTIEDLRQDIVQLQTAARIRIDLAARKARKNASDDVLRLVQAADRLIEEFKNRARLWEDLASSALGTAQPFRMDDLVERMVRLLETDARVKAIALSYSKDTPEPVPLAFADTREFSRDLLSAILDFLAVTKSHESVSLTVRAGNNDIRVIIQADEREPVMLVAPCARKVSQ